MVRHTGHGEHAPGEHDRVADLGQPPERGAHVARYGLVLALGQANAGPVCELVRPQGSRDDQGAVRAAAQGPVPAVGFVLELADDLLDDVFEGDETGVIRVIPTWRTISVGPDAVVGEDTTPFTFYAFQRASPAPFTTVTGTAPSAVRCTTRRTCRGRGAPR